MGQSNDKPITVYRDSENVIGDSYEEQEAVDELHLLQKELDSLDTSFEIMKQELVCPLCECIIKMGKFTRKCPLCKTLFHNENIYHSAIVENLVYAYRRCIKSFQEIENHRSESVRSNSNNELNNLNSDNSRYRSRLDDHHNSLPTTTTGTTGTSPTNNNSNSNNNNNNNTHSLGFPRSLSSQYRMPHLNEFFLPDEPPLNTPKTPHELPHIESPHISLLNGDGNNSSSNNNSNIVTPSLSPTGDTFVPSFLDTSTNNLKSSHGHLLKPLDNRPLNLTPPHCTNNYTYNNCRSRGYSDATNASFFGPPSINFHSVEKGSKLIDNSSTSFTLTPVEVVVSTPHTINESDNEIPPPATETINNNIKDIIVDSKKRKDNINLYSTPPLTPDRQQQKQQQQAEESFTSSPEYTYRRLTDDDKEDNYIVVSASPNVNRNKRSIQLDSNVIAESNNNTTSHVIIGSPLCSPNRKKPEMKSIDSMVLDKDDEDAKVIGNVDSILDGMSNCTDSMICHNGDP